MEKKHISSLGAVLLYNAQKDSRQLKAKELVALARGKTIIKSKFGIIYQTGASACNFECMALLNNISMN